MPRYASGKHSQGISDRSGRAYKIKDMLKEWTGLLVGRDEFEAKQPQLNPRKATADPEALRNARPDRVEPEVEVLLQNNAFLTGTAGSSTITVTEPGHNRETGDVVRFRTVVNFDGFTSSAIEYSTGYSITKVEGDGGDQSNSYTFNVSSSGSSETSTTGGVKGGGSFSSAGPVTVSA
jgi:hypothetical protein|tara:strand:- start:254 stop:787 length:534 start_codon:yes stop_codon:yes gene_type:complete